MGWDGDISAMGRLADRIADLSQVPAQASRAVADRIDGLMREEFAAGEDPYGAPWEPLADATLDRGRTPPPLTDSGDMLRSLSVKPLRGAGVAMSVDHPGAPHQTGWVGPQGAGPAREIFPAGDELPDNWIEAIDEEVASAAEERTVRG